MDTEITLLSTTIPSGKGGRIKEIRYSATAASASNGFLELKLGSHSGPYRWAIPSEAKDVTLICGRIECDIEVFANETVIICATLNVAGVDGMASFTWVA